MFMKRHMGFRSNDQHHKVMRPKEGEAWPLYRTSSSVRLCWELEQPEGPKVGGGTRYIKREAKFYR